MQRLSWYGVILAGMLSSSTSGHAQPVFKPCPDRPNCVSSLATDTRHFIEPLHFTDEPGKAWARLKAVLQQQPRTRIVAEQGDYLRAECRSLVFRFVDDVEFVMQPQQQQIQVRSASRTGYSDLGVNRRRVERLREQFTPAKPPG
jgi:uncharacterized protein (DUF1499 family)